MIIAFLSDSAITSRHDRDPGMIPSLWKIVFKDIQHKQENTSAQQVSKVHTGPWKYFIATNKQIKGADMTPISKLNVLQPQKWLSSMPI